MSKTESLDIGIYGLPAPKVAVGQSSRGRMTYAQIVAKDNEPLNPILQPQTEPFPPQVPITFDRYLEKRFVDLEVEHIWNKHWQIACREEDIPNVGDRVSYDIVDQSYVIVRSGPDEFKAFYNTCRHRGRRLCDSKGSGAHIRCPFHAWTWNLDGSLEWVPSEEDFPHVKKRAYGLEQVQVDRWGGNVFINPDPKAKPLSEALGILPDVFADCPIDERYTAQRLRKKIRCNWKLAQEAFMEAYHTLETHWDHMPFFGTSYGQYGEYDDGESHLNWLTTASMVPDHWVFDKISPDDSINHFCTAFGFPFPEKGTIHNFTDARKYIAKCRAEMIRLSTGRDFSDKTTAYLIDYIKAFMFPNHHPWWGEGLPWWYKFTPYEDDPGLCIMEVRILLPTPLNGPIPPSAAPLDIDFDERCADFPALGTAGKLVDQDISNLVAIQKGLKSAAKKNRYMTLAQYQESNIQHFHRVYNKLLGL
jgi:phenylpropionate dioxygenase-like ring-hydroxylating dioxygenase large terminal subunit